METLQQPRTQALLSEFRCDEYFASPQFRAGVFLEQAQLQVIYPESEVRVVRTARFLVIGSAGVDGIEFGYRAGEAGLWAYYPAEREFLRVASSIGQLVEGYSSGALTV